MTRIRARWLAAPAPRAVVAMLEGAGHHALFVGGCVRNALLGLPVWDIDMATDARPETVVALAEAAGLRAVPTGIDHGTVTLVKGGNPVEVTTFRRDVETDGRRAIVAYSDEVAEDAARRDFTINALYARADGTVIDPLGGLPDIAARRVRFIGDPEARIREDYLRILRFFRFSALYGDPDRGLDAEGLAAVAAMAEGLAGISAERIGMEIRKLLDAADPAPAVAAMAASGILARVLPGADPRALAPLVHLEGLHGIAPRWQRRLAALGGGDRRDALRLSRAEARELETLSRLLSRDVPDAAAAHCEGATLATDAALIRAASLGTDPAPGWQARIAAGAAAKFPLTAEDLMPHRAPGPALGAALKALRARWIASGFSLTRDELVAIDRDGRL